VSSGAAEKQAAFEYAGDIPVTELNNSATIQFKTTDKANRFLWVKMMLVKKK